MTKEIAQELSALNSKIDSLYTHQKELFTVKQAATFLGLSTSSLYKLTSQNEITFHRPHGKVILFHKDDLLKWALNNRIEPVQSKEHEDGRN